MTEQEAFEEFIDEYPFPPKTLEACAYTLEEMRLSWQASAKRYQHQIKQLKQLAFVVMNDEMQPQFRRDFAKELYEGK